MFIKYLFYICAGSFVSGDADKGSPNGSITLHLRFKKTYESCLKMEKSARPRTALNECVKVIVRCRPLSEREKKECYDEVSFYPVRPVILMRCLCRLRGVAAWITRTFEKYVLTKDLHSTLRVSILFVSWIYFEII